MSHNTHYTDQEGGYIQHYPAHNYIGNEYPHVQQHNIQQMQIHNQHHGMNQQIGGHHSSSMTTMDPNINTNINTNMNEDMSHNMNNPRVQNNIHMGAHSSAC